MAFPDKANDLLQQVGLASRMHHTPRQLSGGEQQRVALARALAPRPALMLLDEPTQGMSAEDVSTVTDLIKRVVEGRTIVMVEHNLNVVSTLADQITVLNRGEILAEGNYDEVSKNPEVMEAYMGTTDAA